jgi:hypothetical protein
MAKWPGSKNPAGTRSQRGFRPAWEWALEKAQAIHSIRCNQSDLLPLRACPTGTPFQKLTRRGRTRHGSSFVSQRTASRNADPPVTCAWSRSEARNVSHQLEFSCCRRVPSRPRQPPAWAEPPGDSGGSVRLSDPGTFGPPLSLCEVGGPFTSIGRRTSGSTTACEPPILGPLQSGASA